MDNSRTFFGILHGHLVRAGLVLSLLLAGVNPTLAASQKPNFIFVLIDDMGYGDLSCYGGEPGATPNIDRLAKEGVSFSQFYVGAPICSPSRVAFTTGQNPGRWRINSFLASRRENERRGMANWLDVKAPTLARALQKAGYATGHFGKWHMGGQRDISEAPLITEYGFDKSLTQFEGLGDRILPLLDAFDGKPATKYALGSDNLGKGNITWMDRSKVTSAFVDRTIGFIKEAQKDGKPFYVNVWPDDVHSPFFPPKELRGDGSKRQLYLGVLKAMDQQLGPLFEFVRSDPVLSKNTFVILASDNGPEPGAGSAGPFRSTKGSLYEGGIREPFIVWAPGFQPKKAIGKLNKVTVSTALDFTPSVAKLAGVTLSPEHKLDGKDVSEAWLGKSEPKLSRQLFWFRPPDRPGIDGERWPDLATRKENWKLLLMRDGTGAQLYDLSSDPGEKRNLAAKHPEKVRTMGRPLLSWVRTLPEIRWLPTRRGAASSAQAVPGFFMNPLAEGADPWMIRHGTNYLTVQAEGNRGVALYRSDRLSSLGEKHVIWRAPDSGDYSQEIWAPEIHFLDGHWYVYVAASDGHNRNHRMWALRSENEDPFSTYTVHGPLYTGDEPETGANNRWAIDGTVMEHSGKRYFIWSGWEDHRDIQWLYIAEMKDPITLGKRVRLCANDDYVWERVAEKPDERGLHEAPQVLKRGDRTFVVYSCSSSWQPTYKLGLLELQPGGDPLKPADWKKHSQPVFQSTETTFGVGHNCFVQSPDGKEDWIVYHAKMDRRDGWRRALFAQPFKWRSDGFPEFGAPVEAMSMLRVPSGEKVRDAGEEWFSTLAEERDLYAFDYYGHHQFLQFRDGRLHIGIPPKQPINDYRCGEKVVLAKHSWKDVNCSVKVRVIDGGRDAGLLFRCTLPGLGYDAQNGYFAGIIPGTGKVVLGSTDGDSWKQLVIADAGVEAGREYLLGVEAIGPQIKVTLDGKEVIKAEDSEHPAGSVGLRVVDSHAAFRDLRIR